MTHISPARMRPAVDAAPRIDVVQSDKEALTGGGFTTLLESVEQEILAVTYWFDPELIALNGLWVNLAQDLAR